MVNKILFVYVANLELIEKEVVPIGILSLATKINELSIGWTSRVIDMNYAISNGEIELSYTSIILEKDF